MINNLFQSDILLLIIILFILIFILKYFETNIIIILFLFIFIFVNYKDILNKYSEIKDKNKPIDRIIEDNRRLKREINITDELNEYLYKLKKYRKYNPQSYDEGYKYIKMFMYIIHDLEKDNISHPRQYFENAQLYLKKSINYFQSITISVPEEKYIHALKYNQYKETKLLNKIGLLCKDIYQYCYYLLYNLSLRFNKDFFDKPDIYKIEINLNVDQVEENNRFTDNYELY